MKNRLNIPDIITKISRSTDETTILTYVNIMTSMFAKPILYFGSISNFLVRFFLLKEPLKLCLMDSLILVGFSLLFEILIKIIKNQKILAQIFSCLFSIILVFIVVEFYYLSGPSLWTISLLLIVVSMLYPDRKMMITLSATISLLVIYSTIQNTYYQMGTIYYIMQSVSLVILFLVSMSVHKILLTRQKVIIEQYQEILTSKENFQLTLSSVGDGVISVDQKGKIQFMNSVAEDITGWTKAEAWGRPFNSIFRIINEQTRKKIKSPVNEVFKNGSIYELENHTILVTKDGTEKPLEDTASPMRDPQGNIIGVVVVFRDCFEKNAKRNRIEYLSYHDQLSGLYNRRFFEEELSRLDTKRNLPLSFIFADVNGLKTINDAFGHECGDDLIRKVSEILKNECRSDDIITRTGGDEFILLLPKTDKNIVEKLIIRLKKRIEEQVIMNIKLSVSFGCDTKENEYESAKEVLKSAENKMYQRKIYHSSSKRSSVLKSILNTLHIKSPREEAHSKRVSMICKAMGEYCEMDSDDIKELELAGELHDIGKIAVDEVVLNKIEKLSEEDWEQLKHHPETGFRLLGTSSEYYNIAEYVLAHHERWDGKGYPKHLKGNEIPLKARIITLADSFDAMTCKRPYRKALSEEEALIEIHKNAGKQFDPKLSKIFVEKILGKMW